MWSMNGSHMIDRLLFLLQRRVVAVKAKIGNPVYGLSTDMGIAYLDFEGGLGATIAHCGYREGVNQFQAEITGTEGQIKISGDRMGGTEFWISRNGKWASQAVPAPATETRNGTQEVSPFTLEVREFARSLIEGRPPSVTAEYGREVVRAMTACEESSRTGREVRLD
jgi:predicted dehydrogenase